MPSSLVASSRRTIRALTLLLAASVIVPAALFALAAWQNHRVLFEEAEQRAQRSADVLRQQAVSTFQVYEVVFRRIEELIRASGGRIEFDQLRAALHSFDDQLAAVDAIFVMDVGGRVVAHSRVETPPEGVFAGDRDYFVALKTDPFHTSIGEPVAGRITGKPRLNIAHRMTGTDGRYAWAIAISVSEGYFADFHSSLRASPRDSMSLIRADGLILARTPELPARTLANPLASFGPGIEQVVRRSPGIVDGVERIYAYRRIGDYPLYVAFGLDVGTILHAWYRNLAVDALIAMPAALLLFAASWIALRRARQEELAALRLRDEMAQRAATEEALRQAQKLEAIGRLAGGVAHDFNNLLTIIAGNVELVRGRIVEEPLKRMLNASLQAAERGEKLTRQLLAFGRRGPVRADIVDLGDTLRHAADLFGHSLGRDLAVTVDVPPGLWPVRVDPEEFRLALLNLAINARDAMPNGGTLRIVARNLAAGEAAGRPADLPGDLVAVAVADEGAGIPAEILPRVFEPFYTTKEVGKGSGLGLSQVYGFAKQSGGTASVDSAPGEGTTVTIFLPRAAAPSGVRDEAGTAGDDDRTGPTSDRRMRVLVVDDDPDVRELADETLRQLGHEPVTACRAAEALERLATGERFDLVFSDIVMPGMSGIDMAQEIRRRHPGLPVLLTTGFSDQARLGAHDFPVLPKPYHLESLGEAVRRCLRAAESSAP